MFVCVLEALASILVLNCPKDCALSHASTRPLSPLVSSLKPYRMLMLDRRAHNATEKQPFTSLR